MPPRIQFDGMFRPSPRTNVIPGAWYVGFHCSACARPIAVLDDPTGSGVLEIGGAGEFEVQCPSCGQARVYPASAMVLWQATTGSPSGLD